MKTLLAIFFQISILLTLSGQNKIPGHYNQRATIFETSDKRYWIDYFHYGVAKISKGGYLGLMDSTGLILCEPVYDKIFDFEGDVARVCLNNKYGLINKKGKEIYPPQSIYVAEFSEHLTWFKNDSGIWGCINDKGETIIKPKFDRVSSFKEGMAIFYYENNIGTVDANGKEIIYFNLNPEKVSNYKEFEQEIFKGISSFINEDEPSQILTEKSDKNLLRFSQGLAVSLRSDNGRYKYGYVGPDGHEKIPFNFDNAHDFVKGYACVEKKGKWGVINQKGDFVIPPLYETAQGTPINRFIISDKNKLGVVDLNNRKVIPLMYGKIKYLFDDLFSISNQIDSDNNNSGITQMHKLAGSWGVINLNGELILPMEFDVIDILNKNIGAGFKFSLRSDNSAMLGDDPMKEQSKSQPRYAIDISAKYILFSPKGIINKVPYDYNFGSVIATKPVFDFIDFKRYTNTVKYFEGILSVVRDSTTFYLNKEGREIVFNNQNIISKSSSTRKDFIPKYNQKGKWEIVNNSNKIITPFLYENVKILSAGAVVRTGVKFGFVDLLGNLVLPPVYDNIEENNSGTLKVSMNSESFFIDKKGNKVD
jgi:hypothetical protein